MSFKARRLRQKQKFNNMLTHWFQVSIFWTISPFFGQKEGVPLNVFFSFKPSKSPLSIFLSTDANLKIIEKKTDLWGAKNWRPIWPKKIFWLFHAETTWECFSRRKKIFLKKFFLEGFVKFDGEHQSGAALRCDHYTPKSSAWHFYL